MTPFSAFWDASTFAELKSGAQIPGRLAHLENQLPWYRFPSLLEKQVATRDNEQCLITGSRSNDTEISVTWIIPPAWVDWVCMQPFFRPFIPSNAILMRNDLIDAFHDNAFGIDVDVRISLTLPLLHALTHLRSTS
ncbi:hypothetical protein GALMADRAFT_1215061 [Galerina marginata CBS 339.88]|uniref:HNH nuclease domain-containing protein n=1 Tax=Galerina marginata (strain CBS 339.88) TaxID=685588 RepID=A0A067SE03_GALM3|nr:hypothetical protein GALMADRAFT_1215061 [Galerina marginata CBS 339.88]